MFNAKLATFALSLEASALATLFTDAPNQQILLWFLLVHADRKSTRLNSSH